jgi:hypothetical protein
MEKKKIDFDDVESLIEIVHQIMEEHLIKLLSHQTYHIKKPSQPTPPSVH